jgi:hypothetical protein
METVAPSARESSLGSLKAKYVVDKLHVSIKKKHNVEQFPFVKDPLSALIFANSSFSGSQSSASIA